MIERGLDGWSCFFLQPRNIKVSNLSSTRFLKMLNSNKPVIFEVIVDPDQNFSPKLTSRKLDDGTMISPSLDDMSPFLDRKEHSENIL